MSRIKFLLILIILLLIPTVFLGFKRLIQLKAIKVEVGDSGFSPSVINIEKGRRVDFVIKSSRSHWVASNSHPTHKDYPTESKGCIGSGLDACRGMKEGETYSFTFNNEGEWGIHDHLFPGFTMVVNVRGGRSANNPSQISNVSVPTTTEFLKLSYQDKQQVIKTLSDQDPQKAWGYLKEVMTKDRVMRNIHELAHIIGNTQYKKKGFQSISSCTHDFGYACYHGITEQMFLEKGPVSISAIEQECIKFFGETGIELLRCVHGMGHGLITYEDFNVRRALPQCEQLKKENRESCYVGVYMGYVEIAEKSVFDPDNPWKFCGSFDTQYQSVCSTFVPTFLLRHIQFNEEEYKNKCKSLPEQEFINECTKHVPKGVATQVLE